MCIYIYIYCFSVFITLSTDILITVDIVYSKEPDIFFTVDIFYFSRPSMLESKEAKKTILRELVN